MFSPQTLRVFFRIDGPETEIKLGTGTGWATGDQREPGRMDQVTAVVETIHEGNLRVLTTRYLSECGCEWVVDMWGNVRRVIVCPRDTDDIRYLDQLKLEFTPLVHEPGLE